MSTYPYPECETCSANNCTEAKNFSMLIVLLRAMAKSESTASGRPYEEVLDGYRQQFGDLNSFLGVDG